MKRTGSGFTIVELLIVIVVIAILAAITIVAYNGIQARAQNTQLLAKVDAYTKAFQLYKAQVGSYPTVDAAESGAQNNGCLGSATSFPADATYAAGECVILNTTRYKTSTTLMEQLKTYASGLPETSLPPISSSDNSVKIRGIIYGTIPPNYAIIQYIIQGDKDCARGAKNYNLAAYPGMTVCTVTLQ